MWFEMRVSSAKNTRRYCARIGTSRSSSFSIASTKLCSMHIGRAVIEPVEIRDRLRVGLVLDQLLGAAVEQPDMRIDPLDDLAVELHDEAEHAVRGGMLRAEVDRVVLDRDVARLRVRGVGVVLDLLDRGIDQGVGHWFCPPLPGTTSGLAGSGALSWVGLPAPVCAVDGVSLGVGAGEALALCAASALLDRGRGERRRRALGFGQFRLLVAGKDVFGALPRDS